MFNQCHLHRAECETTRKTVLEVAGDRTCALSAPRLSRDAFDSPPSPWLVPRSGDGFELKMKNWPNTESTMSVRQWRRCQIVAPLFGKPKPGGGDSFSVWVIPRVCSSFQEMNESSRKLSFEGPWTCFERYVN